MKEQEIEDYLVKKANEIGCYCIKLNPAIEAGIPDRLIITLDGRCLFVELKCNEGKLSFNQLYTQERLKKMHHLVYTIWNKDSVDDFLNKEILYK